MVDRWNDENSETVSILHKTEINLLAKPLKRLNITNLVSLSVVLQARVTFQSFQFVINWWGTTTGTASGGRR